MNLRLPVAILFLLLAIQFVPLHANAQAAPGKNKIICDHAAPPRGMHYVCKSQCDCHLEGKLKNDEDGIEPAPAVAQDVKITTVKTTEMNGNVFRSTNTIYVHGERTRRDFSAQLPDGSTREQAFIDLCDSHQAIELDPQSREYRVVELGEDGLAKDWQKHMRRPEAQDPKRGGTVEIVTENTDTHETKNMLGHVAHHWLTTQQRVPGEGACTSADASETDGWYIDYAAPAATCRDRVMRKEIPPGAKVHAVLTAVQSDCADRFKFTGEQMNHGMAVLLTHVTHFQRRMPDGTQVESSSRSTMEVTELSTAPIEAQTLEVPAGYKRVARLRTDGPPPTVSERLRAMWEELKMALRN